MGGPTYGVGPIDLRAIVTVALVVRRKVVEILLEVSHCLDVAPVRAG